MASTTGIDTWAVDLAEVGPIYPFQGSEAILVIVALALWIGWHVLQTVNERRENDEKVRRYGDRENLEHVVDEHGD